MSSSPPSSSSSSENESSLILNFVSAWNGFYEKANRVVQSSPLDDTKLRSILESLTTLMSGLDEPKKSVAVSYGALVLAVEAIRKLDRNLDDTGRTRTCDSMNVIVGLKAVKSCVVRNPKGRAKCRQEGVFGVLSSILFNAHAVDTDMQILEETYTTLAAVCLGDDLNALQAALAYREKVKEALRRYCREKHGSLHQKLVYLQALFRAMETEQADLLENCDNPSTLFKTIETAENNLLEGINKEQRNRWSGAETAYTNALNRIQFIMSHTELLDDLLARILDNRSSVRLKLQDWNGALDDADACLITNTKKKHLSSACVVMALQARRSDALHQLGRMQEAGQALDKALAISPRDKTLLSKINRLQLAKIKSCKQTSLQRRSRRKNETNVVELESWLALAGRRRQEQCLPMNDRVRHRRRHQQQQQQCMCTIPTAKHDFAPRLGTCVKSIYGTGIVQEVRKCGTAKIQLESWSPGAQQPTAYLMPEFYTVVVVSE
jgi:tetratricopeptide (TPR) repeat protein